ncbi:hypothetical protein G6F18_003757 [Rhizopus arrhizus]|nr:hypothetical protein G6F18_003757 [Rhizopus arrhizus]
MNGQSNTHNNNKSIKHENSQHQLNVILSDIETNYDPSQIELCAAIRPERPPDVTTATPYNKIKPTSKKLPRKETAHSIDTGKSIHIVTENIDNSFECESFSDLALNYTLTFRIMTFLIIHASVKLDYTRLSFLFQV